MGVANREPEDGMGGPGGLEGSIGGGGGGVLLVKLFLVIGLGNFKPPVPAPDPEDLNLIPDTRWPRPGTRE